MSSKVPSCPKGAIVETSAFGLLGVFGVMTFEVRGNKYEGI